MSEEETEETEETDSTVESIEKIVKEIGDQQPEMYSRIAELEVHTVGGCSDSLEDVAESHREEFAKTVDAYTEHRDSDNGGWK